jgi:hypothetical protein
MQEMKNNDVKMNNKHPRIDWHVNTEYTVITWPKTNKSLLFQKEESKKKKEKKERRKRGKGKRKRKTLLQPPAILYVERNHSHRALYHRKHREMPLLLLRKTA